MIPLQREEADEHDTEVFADVDRMDAKARHGWGSARGRQLPLLERTKPSKVVTPRSGANFRGEK